MLTIDAATTAIIHIDLQKSNVARTLAPHPADLVVANCVRLADALRARGGAVVHVHVLVHEMLRLPADRSLRPADAPPPPPDAADFAPQAAPRAGDIVVTKRQWGAFYGTDLDQQLRRRGIGTLIMSGIATNFGVESTARQAFDQGYALIFAHDAMSSMRADLHAFSVDELFPFMGQVRATGELVAAIG
jgi:nicotinamidase-related amidase